MPKIDIFKVFGCPIFQGRSEYSHNTNINMYLLIEIRFNILYTPCLGYYIEVEKN